MDNYTSLYNGLPSLTDADKMIVNRDQIFANLAPVFAAHGNKYGVCLVHRHCILEEGEVMVATGDVTKPEENAQGCYPQRWLATGEPYEFGRNPCPPPPQGLLEEFQRIVGGIKVLGLFCAEDEDWNRVSVERTEGRKNIVKVFSRSNKTSAKNIETGWLVRSSGPFILVHSCATCWVRNGSHTQSMDKMGQLERRPDLGHEIDF